MLLTEAKYAVRALKRRWALSCAAVATVALGIGISTAVASVIRNVLLKPLPYLRSESLAMVWYSRGNAPELQRGIVPALSVLEWRQRTLPFSDIAAIELWTTNTSSRLDFRGSERLHGSFATPNFFDVLGVDARIGRTFSASDDGNVAVISHGLWTRLFGTDPQIIGQTILLAGDVERHSEAFTIIGVLPRAFHFTYPVETEVWILRPWEAIKRAPPLPLQFHVIGRLQNGIDRDAAARQMRAINANVASAYPQYAFLSASTVYLEPVRDFALGDTRPAMTVLSAITLFLAAVSIINLAQLMLSFAVERQRDHAVARALGASPAVVVRERLVQSGLIAFAGWMVGVGLAAILQPLIRWLIPETVPRHDEIALDFVTFGWSIAVSLLAVTASLLPKVAGSSSSVHEVLRAFDATTTASLRTVRWRNTLVGAQIATVGICCIVSGLLIRSLWNLRQVDLGFNSARIVAAEIRLLDRLSPHERSAFQDELLERVRQVPGVSAASISSAIPLQGTDLRRLIRLERADTRGQLVVNQRAVDEQYFRILAIPVIHGRSFGAGDTHTGRRVAILSKSAAVALFRTEDPVGEVLKLPEETEIVGVVGDVRYKAVDQEAAPALYLPRRQAPSGLTCVIVQDAGVVDFPQAIRRAVAEVRRGQPVERISRLDEIVEQSIGVRRSLTIAVSAFASIALLLALAGLFGIVVQFVVQQRRHLAIRCALGASPNALVLFVLRTMMKPVLIGLAIGAVASTWVSHIVRAFLFETSATDSMTFGGVTSLVLAFSALACLAAVHRAMNANPTMLLRDN